MAPRQPIPLREVLYQLSPYQQSVVGQAFKNAPKTFLHFLQQRGPGLLITFGTYKFGVWGIPMSPGSTIVEWWTENEIHKERMKERF